MLGFLGFGPIGCVLALPAVCCVNAVHETTSCSLMAKVEDINVVRAPKRQFRFRVSYSEEE